MTFKDLHIIDPIIRALVDEGYSNPTPIQEQSIPILLRGKDLLGCAQTGTGKTAAFAIPILQHLYLNKNKHKGPRRIKALIVTPTRELAIQIADSFSTYGKYTGIKNTVIFGGVKQGAQTNALQRGVDVLVATPGRLLDLIGQGFITLKHIEYFVLDEADHMLDMGFIHDIRSVIAFLPVKRQSLFFSATMPPAIRNLSAKILVDPEGVSITPKQATAEKVDQSLYYVTKKGKPKLLLHLLKDKPGESVLVFSRTKYGANRIAKSLSKAKIKADAIHSNKSQGVRQKTLGDFKKGKINVLVATDIAARGIDVEKISLVVNYDLPNIPETYVHRIGRTGRAEESGVAVSFVDTDEKPYLKDIQKLIHQQITVVAEHPFIDFGSDDPPKAPAPSNKPQKHWRQDKKGYKGGSNKSKGPNAKRKVKSGNR